VSFGGEFLRCEQQEAASADGPELAARQIEMADGGASDEDAAGALAVAVDDNFPLLLRHAAARWPCAKLWQNLTYLHTALGETQTEVEVYGASNPERFCSLDDSAYREMSLASVLDFWAAQSTHAQEQRTDAPHAAPSSAAPSRATKPTPGTQEEAGTQEESLVVAELDFIVREEWKTLHALASDFPFPFLFDRRLHAKTSLFMGPSTYTSSHYHVNTEALLCQVVGTKRVGLLPPNVTDPVLLNRDPAGIYRNQPRTGITTDRAYLEDPRTLIVDLAPLSCLYVPLRWWHVTFGGAEVGVAIAHFWAALPSKLRRVTEPNPLPPGAEEKYFRLLEDDPTYTEAVEAAEEAAAASPAATTVDGHDGALSCADLATHATPQWACEASSGGTNSPESVGPDEVEDDNIQSVSCPIIPQSLHGIAMPFEMRCTSVDCLVHCQKQRSCVAMQARPTDPRPHLELAEALLDVTRHNCEGIPIGARPCYWSCPRLKDVQQAAGHARIARRLALESECTPARDEECTEQRAALLQRTDATLAALESGEGLAAVLGGRRLSEADDAASLGAHALLEPFEANGALERDRRSLSGSPLYAALGAGVDGSVAVPPLRPHRRVALRTGGQVWQYRVEDILPESSLGPSLSAVGWPALLHSLAAAVDASFEQHQEHTADYHHMDGGALNLDFFQKQDAGLLSTEMAEPQCQLGTMLPEIRELPSWQACRMAMVRAGRDFEQQHLPMADPEGALPPLAAPCGGVRPSATWHSAARPAGGFTASFSSKRNGSTHEWHTHIESSVTGVIYLSTPPGSSTLAFDDGHERATFSPSAGDVTCRGRRSCKPPACLLLLLRVCCLCAWLTHLSSALSLALSRSRHRRLCSSPRGCGTWRT
jgi:hypothetical protein